MCKYLHVSCVDKSLGPHQLHSNNGWCKISLFCIGLSAIFIHLLAKTCVAIDARDSSLSLEFQFYYAFLESLAVVFSRFWSLICVFKVIGRSIASET